jgi:uncharacterized cupin superfamily protein
VILRGGSVAGQRVEGSAPRIEERFGDVAGLRIMGVNIVTLAPGERSAQRHWHSGSDEFVMVLEGTATVIEDDAETEIGPGDLALWPAGSEIAHQVVNRSKAPLRYLCAGTNPEAETVRYPDEAETLHWIRPNWHVLGDDGTIRRRGTE